MNKTEVLQLHHYNENIMQGILIIFYVPAKDTRYFKYNIFN
jgi:hypothetical protein